MTLSRIAQTGSGRLMARVEFEGMEHQFVSDRRMVRTLADGRSRVYGLLFSSLRWGQRVHIPEAAVDAQGPTVRIANVTQGSGKNIANLAFARKPSATAYITSNVTRSATTIPVADSTLLPSSGVVHVATEAIAYTGKTPTSLTGCTRGVWNTAAQAHFTADGEGLAYPKITNVPAGIESRRAWIYLYGDGDDPQGDGALQFTGFVTGAPRFNRGQEWSIPIDSVARLLDQNVGSDLAGEVPIRGIYYTTRAPLQLVVLNESSGLAAIAKLSGFYETQEAFCEELTTIINTQIVALGGGWSWGGSNDGSIVVQPRGFDGWEVVYRTSTTGTPSVVTLTNGALASSLSRTTGARFSSQVDSPVGENWLGDDGGIVFATEFAANSRYRFPFSALVPRATSGNFGRTDLDPTPGTEPSDPTASPRRIYLGGTVVPTVSMSFILQNADGESSTVYRVISADAINRYVEVHNQTFTVYGPASLFKVGRLITTGSVKTLIDTLISQSPDQCNAGAMPLVRPGDITFASDVEAAIAETPLALNRDFVAYGAVRVGDIVREELKTFGGYLRIASGPLEVALARLAVPTDQASWVLDTTSIKAHPDVAISADGVFSEVSYSTDYDPQKDKHTGPTLRYRDVSASSPNRVARTFQIAQRSVAEDAVFGNGAVLSATREQVQSAALTVFSMFGEEYDTITCQTTMRFFAARVGEFARFTYPTVPNVLGETGTVDALTTIIGVSFESPGVMSLELFRHAQAVAGYAPGFRITSSTLVSGSTYDIAINLSDYTTAASIAAWLEAGDLVAVLQYDSLTPDDRDGTVVSIISPTVVRVSFAAPVTITGEWSLTIRDSEAYASGDKLARFAFQGTTGQLTTHSDGSKPAKVFS